MYLWLYKSLTYGFWSTLYRSKFTSRKLVILALVVTVMRRSWSLTNLIKSFLRRVAFCALDLRRNMIPSFLYRPVFIIYKINPRHQRNIMPTAVCNSKILQIVLQHNCPPYKMFIIKANTKVIDFFLQVFR